ncbi:hypothetical protein H6P81_005239 [Aristolochia fimbriata]|uniref:Transmembrane protein n=1 Tax=Aristolochia fimbriata TaxID=158543 RepID=A0AAV7EW41_ARIFI|nr:hypothetical protein H6P81_005239 [Aristolochia fimbriata]
MNMAMASQLSASKITHATVFQRLTSWQVLRPRQSFVPSINHLKRTRLSCTRLPPWGEASPLPYSANIESDEKSNDSSIFDSIIRLDKNPPLLPDSEQNVEDENNQSVVPLQPLKWPMWLLGPSVVLITGVIPTLWLPLSSVFLGPNIAGLLSLVGLDCIFNMGATLFLLMADACARPKSSMQSCKSEVPFSYKFWNIISSIMGFLAPLMMLLASSKGLVQPQLPFIPFTVLLGPYLLLLSVQMLTEVLTWHWKSPVWLVTPIVYEAYRVLQLMRGLRLGSEIGAPLWAVECIRCLVSWWVLVLGMQLMRVAWYAGFTTRIQQERG